MKLFPYHLFLPLLLSLLSPASHLPSWFSFIQMKLFPLSYPNSLPRSHSCILRPSTPNHALPPILSTLNNTCLMSWHLPHPELTYSSPHPTMSSSQHGQPQASSHAMSLQPPALITAIDLQPSALSPYTNSTTKHHIGINASHFDCSLYRGLPNTTTIKHDTIQHCSNTQRAPEAAILIVPSVRPLESKLLLSIFESISCPDTTSPKTTCLPSR